jgi:uncharacterized membrane protein
VSFVTSIVIVYSRIQSIASKILKYCQMKNTVRNYFWGSWWHQPVAKNLPRKNSRKYGFLYKEVEPPKGLSPNSKYTQDPKMHVRVYSVVHRIPRTIRFEWNVPFTPSFSVFRPRVHWFSINGCRISLLDKHGELEIIGLSDNPILGFLLYDNNCPEECR